MRSKQNHFPNSLWDLIRSGLDHAQKSIPEPWMAAFDADGTLWDCDVGENFFHYQIGNSNLPNLPADPWQHYLDWKMRDRLAAYLWLAQINKGQNINTVLNWAKQAVGQSSDFQVFDSQAQLIKELQDRGVDVYIVSASVEWAVVPPAALLGVARENVIGVRTKVENNVVTDRGEFPVSWGPGKPVALAQAAPGKNLILASGNTNGDAPLISAASHVHLAVRSKTNMEGPLWQSEIDLFKIAQEKSWLMHVF